MTALELAQDKVRQAQEWAKQIGTTKYKIDDEQYAVSAGACLLMAERYAAVATAEAAVRQADALEGILELLKAVEVILDMAKANHIIQAIEDINAIREAHLSQENSQ